MISLQSIQSPARPASTPAVSPSPAAATPSAPHVAPTPADAVEISDAARALQAVPPARDPSTIPGIIPIAHFGDEATLKAAMKEDFLSKGIYVDDAYINAWYKAAADINYDKDTAPDMPLPTPPAWWPGYHYG